MPSRIERADYAAAHGPTAGDRVRLADTNLFARLERDDTLPGHELDWGMGRPMRDGMLIGREPGPSTLDLLVMNVLVMDPVLGIFKSNIGVKDGRMRGVVEKLKRHFHVAHLHFNNFSCVEDLLPFPSWAYEVLFVSKRLGVIDPNGKAGGVHPLDAPNNPNWPDCQPTSRDVKPEIATAPTAALP